MENNVVKLKDLHFTEIITAEQVSGIVSYLAESVQNDMPDGEVPLFVAILNGSFVFAADFVRAYKSDCEISFVKLASYKGTESTNSVKELVGLTHDLTNRTVVILEDIIDSGATLQEIYNIFRDMPIKQLKIVTLLFKPDVYRKELSIDYIGKNIGDDFVVGYGLDYNELGRNLTGVYQLAK